MSTITTTTTIEPAIELSALPEKDVRRGVQWQEPSENGPVTMAVTEAEEDVKSKRLLYLKMFSAGYSFFVAGINDGSLGPIIPYLLREYNISTGTVSLMYLLTYLSPSLFSSITKLIRNKATQHLAQAG